MTAGVLVLGAAPDPEGDLGGQVAAATDDWLSSFPSRATRRGYANDLGVRLPVEHPNKGPARSPLLGGCAWLVWLHANGLHPLTVVESDVVRWLNALRDADFADATQARALATVRSWYRYLKRRELIVESPAAEVSPAAQGIHVPLTSPTIVLSAEHTAALIAAADGTRGSMRLRAAAIVAVLFLMGLRVGELCQLRVGDRIRHGGRRKLRVTGKGGRHRRVDLPDLADERIERYLASRPELKTVAVRGPAGDRVPVPLFATRTGRPVSAHEVFRLLRRLAREAELPPEVIAALTPHAGRHTTAELARVAGHDIHEIKELLGHASITTTQRYLHGSGEHLPQSVAGVVAKELVPAPGG